MGLAIEQAAMADRVAAELAADDPFDWVAWYTEQRDAFLAAAASWRQIAHTAQLAGESDVVRLAHFNALDNTQLAAQAERKRKEHA